MLLTEKYAPNTLNMIVGNGSSIDRLMDFATDAQKGIVGRPIMIYGPPGTGKTAAAHALAYSNGFELLEFSASDYRDATTLSKLLLPAGQSSSLFKKKLLIVMDEVDELSTLDAGAERIITNLVNTSRHPIIFIANDFWNRKISFLRERVEKVEFKKVGRDEVLELLKRILKKERKKLDEKVLEEIAQRSSGDVRGAINDLELMIDANPELIENLGMRDRRLEVFGVLDKIFLSNNFEIARNAYNITDLDSNMLLNWIEENIPNRYVSKIDLNNAYTQVAKASFFMEKASRNNYWGYLRYAGTIMSSGVSVSNTGSLSYLKRYEFPTVIRYFSKTKSNRSALAGVLSKLIRVLHAHKKDIVNEYLPLIKMMVEQGIKEEGESTTFDFFERVYGLEKGDIEAIVAN